MKKPPKEKKQIPAKTVTKIKQHPVSVFNFDMWFPRIVFLFGLLLYINTLHHGYVLDDEMVMGKNKIVMQGVSGIPEIMTSAYRSGFWDHKDGLYRPLSLVMFAIEWQLAPNQPVLGHLINILLYALTGFFLYQLLRTWFRDKHPLIPFCIALLFMAHPLHTEVVANIKSRDEILGFLMAVIALLQYQCFAENNKAKNMVIASVFFLLSILSKESYITLFLGIPVAVYFFSETADKKKYLYIFGSLSLAVVLYLCLRIYSLGELVSFNKIDTINNTMAGAQTIGEKVSYSILLVGMYLRLFLFPHPLSFDYSFNSIPLSNLSDPRFILSFLVLAVLTGYAVLNTKKRDPVTFGILFFGITISIVSNLVILIECTVAERFLYLPSLGLCTASVFLFTRLFKTNTATGGSLKNYMARNKYFFLLLGIILVLFSVKVISRNRDWKSDLILFGADKDHNPNSWRTNYSYANAFYYKQVDTIKNDPELKKQLSQEVIFYLKKSMAILPDNYQSWYLLGLNLEETGQMPEAYDAITRTLQIDSTDANAWYIFGNWYAKGGDFRQAIPKYEKALSLNPMMTDAYNNKGNCFAVMEQYDSALVQYKKVLEIDPGHKQAIQNIATTYIKLGMPEKAKEYNMQLGN